MLRALLLLSGCVVGGDALRVLRLSRREVAFTTAWATAGAGPAFAVPPPSPQQMLKSRAVYGSRIYRLQDATPAKVIEEKNAFALFISGVYASSADKPVRVKLEKLEKAALAAAKKGDTSGAREAVREFVALGQITELDRVPGTYFNSASPCDRAGLQCGFKADEVRKEMFEADQTPLGDFGKSVAKR